MEKVTELHENAQHAFLHKAHKEFESFPIRDLNGKERDFAKLSDFDAAMLTPTMRFKLPGTVNEHNFKIVDDAKKEIK